MTFPILLQVIADTVASPAVQMPVVSAPKSEQLSLWYLIKEGGILMIPLLLCSIIAIYVFVERMLVIKKLGNTPNDFMRRIKEKVLEGNIAGAQSICKNYDTAISRVILKGLSRIGKPIDHIERSMENVGKLQVYQMEKNIGVLSVVAGIAPIFGFLGTIVGMIILFSSIQQTNTFEIGTMAGGIYTKMVTSAAGLIIGLLATVAYSFINSQINRQVNKIETAATEFLDILHEPAVK